MAADKRTTVRLSEKLLRRARKTLKASTNEDAVTKESAKAAAGSLTSTTDDRAQAWARTICRRRC